MALIDTENGFRVSRRIYHDPEIHRRELDSIFKKSCSSWGTSPRSPSRATT